MSPTIEDNQEAEEFSCSPQRGYNSPLTMKPSEPTSQQAVGFFFDWGNLPRLSERVSSLRAQFRAPLRPLTPSQYYRIEGNKGFRGRRAIVLRVYITAVYIWPVLGTVLFLC